ncbi:HalOD1 output domain-containing protein [Halorubrum ezzemoulense]|jgi:hypothetical protein|uniref:HalOD1 output domain-containing protein n=1 Tax=Halorubrum ezzemoulense TaxID=337243 RepID=UPI00232F4095|nr:HalOD1 output domain-containing protein [Halorubrum ezzemoulense]MDB9234899.1 hypothetical protein [Halorubrum ezzemoulense]MDB9254155.1 hypothetical protein [Halorubrum ezzemoulense]MDB9257333.1 hypothetical protein [Halorubrum ezzemoulense]MDB9277303.1 hypothetical protein [Halorubrum ezzemoulense]
MGRTVVEKIIEGIADAKGVEPENLNIMLENYVSTDAIRALKSHQGDSWRLQFETPKHVVEVAGNETLLIDGTEV